MSSMIIQNARLQDREGLHQVVIEHGKFSQIRDNDHAIDSQIEVIDAEGGLAVAPFCEPHIHLDTTQTAGERTGISLEHCLKVLNVGQNAKQCFLSKMLSNGLSRR